MSNSHSLENDFLSKITEIIEDNISSEQFGVSELAREMGMSRSNLLRKVKKLTKVSVSRFIRQVRLKHAMELLKQSSFNVSEVSYKVGFSSISYFIKCFRDHYGYPPGEVGKIDVNKSDPVPTDHLKKKRRWAILWAMLIILLLATTFVIFFKPLFSRQKNSEKSIAVLPFINDSNDSSNVYIINGIMESILNNLQKIENLRVISRTSVERYRNTPKTISKIARELNAHYFVEGSGQKIDDQILLNIQLIEAKGDKHLWSEQYNREAKDIFNLQKEVAKKIAGEIEVIITPAEEKRINKIPTNDLVAYDYFLKGLDLFYKGNRESLKEAIPFFNKAVEHDPEFARAYADMAIVYYFLDVLQSEKKHVAQITDYADKALLFDSQLPQSLIAKALSYMIRGENESAVPYLEKALEYNPNSALVINTLSDFYANYIPNTEKYLEYALKGIQLDIAAHDSVTASFIYLHVSNALIQSGFTDEAEMYINRSLDYNSENLYSEYVRAYIIYAKNGDIFQLKESLIKALNKDITRLDIMQEVGKICYYMRDYESAYMYYRKFLDIKEAQQLGIYRFENAKIGMVLAETGHTKEAEKLLADYKDYAEKDQSIYKHLSLSMYYSYMGDTKNAVEQLRLFSQQNNNYHYWTILFLKIDPLIDNMKNHPEFKKILDNIDTKFQDRHKRLESSLEKKRLIGFRQ